MLKVVFNDSITRFYTSLSYRLIFFLLEIELDTDLTRVSSIYHNTDLIRLCAILPYSAFHVPLRLNLILI